jgi:antibiotic biosynthesis monooxygenase (ABM) superfamily enzyme
MKSAESSHRLLGQFVMTITAWPFAFLAVLTLFTVFDDELGSLPLAARALVVSGVLVTLMANVVMPVLRVVVNRLLAGITTSSLSTDVYAKEEE